MRRRVADYLPFMGVVLVVCTASWLAGRSRFGGAYGVRSAAGHTIGR